MITLWAKQGIFAKAFPETLRKRFHGQYAVTPGVIRHVGRYNIGQLFSHLLIADIAVKTVITNSLKSLGQDVLHHSSQELKGWEVCVLNLSGFVVPVPVSDGLAVVVFDSAYRDRRRDDILGQILRQSLSSRRHITLLQKSNKAFWVFFPGPIEVFFHVWIANIFPQHFQEVVLPFSVHHFVGDIRNRFPWAFFVESSGRHEDMQVGVVMAGSSGGLQDDDISDVERDTGAGVENIFQTGMSCSHEKTEQFRMAKKPGMKEFRRGQYYVAICDAGQQPSSDEVGPSVGVHLGTGKTETGLAGESNSAYCSAEAASVLGKAHLVGIATAEHFLDSLVKIRMIESWTELFKRLPVVIEYLLKGVFIDARHGGFLRTTITELAA
jgi:hypothetical protein